MKRFKNWVYSNKIIHHISKRLDHEVKETKTTLLGVVIKRKLLTLMFSRIYS